MDIEETGEIHIYIIKIKYLFYNIVSIAPSVIIFDSSFTNFFIIPRQLLFLFETLLVPVRIKILLYLLRFNKCDFRNTHNIV